MRTGNRRCVSPSKLPSGEVGWERLSGWFVTFLLGTGVKLAPVESAETNALDQSRRLSISCRIIAGIYLRRFWVRGTFMTDRLSIIRVGDLKIDVLAKTIFRSRSGGGNRFGSWVVIHHDQQSL